MSLQSELLDEIAAYVKAAGMAETTFGRLAVNDGKFVGRLRAEKGVTVRLLEKARQYIADHPIAPSNGDKPEAA